MNRNIEDDLKGLVSFAKACFRQRATRIPKYKGQLVERKAFDGFNIDKVLDPASEAYDYNIQNGRNLLEMILGCAYKLGYDSCYMNEVEPNTRVIGMTNAINADVLESIRKSQQSFSDCASEEGIKVGLIDAIITISNLLAKFDLTNQPMAVNDALKDLIDNKNLKKILKSRDWAK